MSLRDAMPETAAFIDAMREAFGVEGIHTQIRAGMQGIPGKFWAQEGGQEVGTPAADGGRLVNVGQMVIEVKK